MSTVCRLIHVTLFFQAPILFLRGSSFFEVAESGSSSRSVGNRWAVLVGDVLRGASMDDDYKVLSEGTRTRRHIRRNLLIVCCFLFFLLCLLPSAHILEHFTCNRTGESFNTGQDIVEAAVHCGSYGSRRGDAGMLRNGLWQRKRDYTWPTPNTAYFERRLSIQQYEHDYPVCQII